jgi:predicted XRE-type DNA-binding protein
MSKDVAVTPSSGNVFADLGFEKPEEELLKAQLVREIRALLKRRRLTQAKAGDALGLAQSDVSAIVNGKVERFSLERLLRCVRRLDQEVAIVVRTKRKPRPARTRKAA